MQTMIIASFCPFSSVFTGNSLLQIRSCQIVLRCVYHIEKVVSCQAVCRFSETFLVL